MTPLLLLTVCLLVRHASSFGSYPSSFGSYKLQPTRRSFVKTVTLITTAIVIPSLASATPPSLSAGDFEALLSKNSNQVSNLLFTGAFSDKVLGTLVDGSQFTVTGLKEDPNSPTSPLKLMSVCRDYGVKYRVEMLPAEGLGGAGSASSATPSQSDAKGGLFDRLLPKKMSKLNKTRKQKKLYTNERVQGAEEKNAEKRRRMEADREAEIEDEREFLERKTKIREQVTNPVSSE